MTSNTSFAIVVCLLVALVIGGLTFGVQRIHAQHSADREWREVNEARLSKYLGETVTIGGVPHTIISAHAYTWNRQCVLKAKAYDKATDLSEATVMALLANAAKVER